MTLTSNPDGDDDGDEIHRSSKNLVNLVNFGISEYFKKFHPAG